MKFFGIDHEKWNSGKTKVGPANMVVVEGHPEWHGAWERPGVSK